MPRFVQKTATILAGESLSSVIDCSTGAPVLIFIPQQWTSSRISFQGSPDGITFYDLFDASAREMASNIRAGTAVLLEPGWSPILYFKIRSGSCDMGVPQEAKRVITVTIDTSQTV